MDFDGVSCNFIVVVLLMLFGGYFDVYMYVGYGYVFVNMMIGNVVLFGINLLVGEWVVVLYYVLLFGGFVFVVFVVYLLGFVV